MSRPTRRTEDHDAYFAKVTEKTLQRWTREEERQQAKERRKRAPWLIEDGCGCCGTPLGDGETLDQETGLCASCAREEP